MEKFEWMRPVSNNDKKFNWRADFEGELGTFDSVGQRTLLFISFPGIRFSIAFDRFNQKLQYMVVMLSTSQELTGRVLFRSVSNFFCQPIAALG